MNTRAPDGANKDEDLDLYKDFVSKYERSDRDEQWAWGWGNASVTTHPPIDKDMDEDMDEDMEEDVEEDVDEDEAEMGWSPPERGWSQMTSLHPSHI